MIDALSSTERSVNNGTICGVVIWIIRNEKKPIRVSVTAAIAAIRAAPSDFTKSKKPCTGFCPTRRGAKRAPYPARFAQFKVRAGLIPSGDCAKEMHGSQQPTWIRRRLTRPRSKSGDGGLLAVLLNAR